MQLQEAAAQSPHLRYIVRDVKPVKIFYAFHGRNAWWATWITRYSKGCMHNEWASAKEYCEKKRVQGTVFYSNELPALAFLSGERALIVSQINSKDILGQLNFERLTDLCSMIPFRTMTFEQLTHVFKSNSSFWPDGFPKNDSIVQLQTEGGSSLLPLAKGDTLLHKTSRAVGTNYYLYWSEQPSEINFDSLISIASTLKDWLVVR